VPAHGLLDGRRFCRADESPGADIRANVTDRAGFDSCAAAFDSDATVLGH
jgi:hypothetical protein